MAVAATARAQDSALPAGFKTQPLLKSGQTRDKQPIAYPKTDKAEIISVIGVIEPGGRTPLHEHPVPTYVYVLEGEVELQSHGGQPHQYKAGERAKADINSGTMPALGSYEGGGYERRQDEGR